MEFYRRKSLLKKTLKETGLFSAFDVLQDDSKMLRLSLKPSVRMFAGDFYEVSISIPNSSCYNSINYVIAKLEDNKKKNLVLRLLHKYNNDSLVIKYYITPQNFITAKIDISDQAITLVDNNLSNYCKMVWELYQMSKMI